MKVKAKLDISDFEKRLSQIKRQSPKAAKDSVTLMANDLQTRLTIALSVGGNGRPSAPGTAPHAQSGNLRKNIFTEVYSGGYARKVKMIAPYAVIHEFGLTVQRKNGVANYPKRPFFEPSFKAMKKNSTAIIKATWKRIL